MSKSLKIAVDFDDTIARNDCWPEIGEELPGAVNGLKLLAQLGHRLFIWTCRHGEALEKARAWLDEREVPYERINENCPVAIEEWGETRKIGADLFIDDKNLGTTINWHHIPFAVERHMKALALKEARQALNKIPKIIALSGKRGSGKDTTAAILHELAGHDFFCEASFAAKLKEFARQLTGHNDMFSQEGKATFLPDWGMTAGEILQKLGTDAVRNGLHENAWVLGCFAGMEPDQHYIITDCRFPNEADAVKARGGIVVRLEGDPMKQQGDGTRDDSHPSETALDNYDGFDIVLLNDGTKEDLKHAIEQFVLWDKRPEKQMLYACASQAGVMHEIPVSLNSGMYNLREAVAKYQQNPF